MTSLSLWSEIWGSQGVGVDLVLVIIVSKIVAKQSGDFFAARFKQCFTEIQALLNQAETLEKWTEVAAPSGPPPE